MKKFSIIVPVFNEEKLILKCLRSIDHINYHNYEVIVVNDGSTDHTKNTIENFIKGKSRFRLINNGKNLGRIQTRFAGAKNAKFDDLVFIDSRVTIARSTLTHLNQKKSPIIIPAKTIIKSNAYGQIIQNLKNRFVWKKSPKKITFKNFDQVPKGMTASYFKKSLFLKSTESLVKSDKNASDDTKLFYKTLKFKKEIIRDKNFKITYHHRNKLTKILIHTFNRGPKFVDYYFKKGKRFFPHLAIIYTLTLINLLLFKITEIYLYELFTIIGLVLFIAIDISKTASQFFVSLYFLPIVGLSFYLGLIKGIIFKLWKKSK